MHDIRAIRENPAAFDAALSRRGLAPQSPAILGLDEARRERIHAAETAQAEQNRASKDAGAARASGNDAEFERLRALIAEQKARIGQMGDEAKALDQQLQDLLLTIPNLPYDDVPDGRDEADNVEIRRCGHPRNFAFSPWNTYQLADAMTAAWISRPRAQAVGQPLRGAVRCHGAPAPGAGAVHARHSCRRARADRNDRPRCWCARR